MMSQEQDAASPSTEAPIPGRSRILTDEILNHLEELLASIKSRSGFGRVILTMANGKIKEAEDQATHRYTS